MLTNTKLRDLKPQDKLYKVNDRDGLYVAVTLAGAISLRYNYSINGRPKAFTFGRYGVGGITLSEAHEQLGEAKKLIAVGKSPAKEKARDKARIKDAETFGAWAEKWPRGYQMDRFTRDMRRSVLERELKPKFGNQKLVEIKASAVVRKSAGSKGVRGARPTSTRRTSSIAWAMLARRARNWSEVTARPGSAFSAQRPGLLVHAARLPRLPSCPWFTLLLDSQNA